MSREAEDITQAHKACLDGADTINVVIATHNKGNDATIDDYGNDMTEDEKKARVTRSVGYLKYQKETYDDWGSKSFTDIDAAISAADTFTG
jgi:Ca2+-binding RTX toxin-like protein